VMYGRLQMVETLMRPIVEIFSEVCKSCVS